MVSEDGVKLLGLEYREVLMGEVRAHRAFARIAVVTGSGLLGLGIAIGYSFSDLGWLLVLVGVLRVVTAIYDLGRKDQLKEALKRLDDRASGKLGDS